jgi:hypothetical protein
LVSAGVLSKDAEAALAAFFSRSATNGDSFFPEGAGAFSVAAGFCGASTTAAGGELVDARHGLDAEQPTAAKAVATDMQRHSETRILASGKDELANERNRETGRVGR